MHRRAVDGDAALDDEALGGPARDHAGRREDFLKSFLHAVILGGAAGTPNDQLPRNCPTRQLPRY